MLLLASIDVEIDRNVVIQCPDIGFQILRAVNCKNCKNYRGLGILNADPRESWENRYAIRCAGVIERRTQRIPEIVEKK